MTAGARVLDDEARVDPCRGAVWEEREADDPAAGLEVAVPEARVVVGLRDDEGELP